MMLLWLALTAAAATDEEVYAAWEAGELLTAARLADERLAERPRSLHANFVKGYVLWREEGEHAAAKHYLDKADEAYWRINPSNDASGPWQVHNDVMQAMIDVASEMDDADLQLELIDRYNELFSPHIEVGRAWPLMKQGRFAAARAAAQLGVDSDDWWEQSSGLNSLCAIESEAMNREEGWRWCHEALVHERTSATPDPTVDANNASSSALGVLDFEAALRLAKEATTGSPSNVSNPYGTLVAHYTRLARGADAIAAVEDMVAWRSRQPANYRDLARSGTDELLARFLYAAGRPDRARELIDRAIQFPDRAGLSSSDPLQAEGRHAALRLSIRRLEDEARREHSARQGFVARTTAWLESWVPDSGVWEDRATLRAALIDDRRSRATFLVYMEGGLNIDPWLMASMSEDVGYGVFLTEVERARSRDAAAGASLASMAPMPHYYDAFLASAAFAHGDWGTVDDLAATAYAGLPKDEALLRAQLAAIVAESAWRSGDSTTALQWFATAMEIDPGAVRRLGIALPARVTGGGNDVSSYVTTMLGRSPRLRHSEVGYDVVVSGIGASVSICLRDRFGAQLSCSSAPGLDGEHSDWDLAGHHVRTWTERTFALSTGASSFDLDSLDGSTLRGGDESGARIDDILDGL